MHQRHRQNNGPVTCNGRPKRDNCRPGRDYDGTWDRGTRRRDVPAKTGRVATDMMYSIQLSTWSSAAVPARRLPTSLRCRVTASSPICWLATAERTAPEAEYICRAGFLCGWSVGVELVAGLPERPGSQQRHFLQAPKDVFVRSVLIRLAH